MSEALPPEEGRVDLHYRVELYGAEKEARLPFCVGVIADFQGSNTDTGDVKALEDRRFLQTDRDNIEDRLRALKPRVAFKVPDTLSGNGELAVDITFEQLDDFSPVNLARKVNGMRELLQVREQLSTLLTYIGDKPQARVLIEEAMHDPSLLQSLLEIPETGEQEGHATAAHGFFQRLAEALSPVTERAQELLRLGLQALAAHVSPAGEVSATSGLAAVEATVSRIDRALADQVELILHHPDFRKLEAAWRGLDHLVRNAGSEEVKIRIFTASHDELVQDIQRTRKILRNMCFTWEYGTPGGEPYGLLVVDHFFWHGDADVELLGTLAEIAEISLSPVVAGAAPALFNGDSFEELRHRRRLADLLRTGPHAAWRQLCQRPEARYIGLIMPRVLGREQHLEPGTLPGVFRYEERARDLEDWPWINPAFVLAARIVQAHIRYGWLAGIAAPDTGGRVEDLPTRDHVSSEGEPVFCCPTETPLFDDTVKQLETIGLIALQHLADTDAAFLSSLPSLYEPTQGRHQPPVESADLTVMLVLCHIGRYLACLYRDRGRWMEPEERIELLNNWLRGYTQTAATEGETPPAWCAPLQYGRIGPQDPCHPDDPLFTAWLQPGYQVTRPLPPIPIPVPIHPDMQK